MKLVELPTVAALVAYLSSRQPELDPQQRLFLETAWESLEHAGYDPYTFDGAIGVYAGMGLSRYLVRNLQEGTSIE
ncbi:beta-ketoacyl synthase N-terminal-like domain-containing protein [Streptomyces sp. NPDC048483]|uniref:beta-ketoacyl synthase N-terminal-like domain-containing protein n=1 Tax=Streptomyces sp. NPDC048483 TaxID=3154927 RepID=UPI0034485415